VLIAPPPPLLSSVQAMILRSQRAWTARSEIERLYFTFENAVDLVHASSVAPRD